MRKQVCVIGMGQIGLPIASVLATSGYNVLGVDINDRKVSELQLGDANSLEPDLQPLFNQAFAQGTFKASIKPAPSDVYIVVVPTFLTTTMGPDLSCVHAAINAIQPYLKSNDLVLIESTCPIGTTEVIACHLRAHCPEVHVAYCPERVLPGNILEELIHNDRVVGGIDPASTSRAASFYRSFIKGEVFSTDASTAEAVKLAENSYRDVNIAFANELSMIADQIQLDINEVIRLANQHPRVQILKPGPGVGGNCIAVNPWFLASAAPALAQLTVKAREVNTQKTEWVIQKIKSVVQENKFHTIACLGLTYKANVSDIRQSPALKIVESLEKEVQVLRVDPHVANTEHLYEAIAAAEIIVGLVAHSEFLQIPSGCLEGKFILDFAGIFDRSVLLKLEESSSLQGGVLQ